MKIVFIDRDGVINENPGVDKFVTNVEEFQFIKGSLDALKDLSDEGYKIFIISNQSCVGRGMITQERLNEIDAHMKKAFVAYGIKLEEAYYATARPDQGCQNRKPDIGFIKQAFAKLGQSMERYASDAFFIGDSDKDIQCAHSAGCQSILVLSGKSTIDDVIDWEYKPTHVSQNLFEATKVVLS